MSRSPSPGPSLTRPDASELDALRDERWVPTIRANAASAAAVAPATPAIRIRPSTAAGPDANLRGTVNAAGGHFFVLRGVDRVRFVVSADRRYCALEPHPTGALLRQRGKSTNLEVLVPADATPGLTLELSPFRDMLIGRYLTATNGDHNGSS